VGRFVKIIISDTGCGIPHDHLSRIFDPYFTTKSDGHGLGLATSYSIILKHGGRISADSVIGKGTTITIYLPAIDAAPVITTNPEFQSLKKPIKILVLEDDESIVSLMTAIFEHAEYESVFTNNGHETIDKYIKSLREKNPFDILILDLTVPGGLGGRDTMTELNKINPRIKVIVSSGYSNDDVLANYKDYGFSNIIVKPYCVDDLLRVITETYMNDY
jgi:two-component system, cell cycle sensor histidine kinase and response regulator CckA